MAAASGGIWVGLASVGVATTVADATADTAASLPQPEAKNSARNKPMIKAWGQGTEIRRFTYHTIIDSIPTRLLNCGCHEKPIFRPVFKIQNLFFIQK